MMTAVASRVPALRCSPATAHPSTTATAGFTNAYVATRVGAVWRRSHMYAENVTTVPMTIR
jgi:hypothetical protein